MKRKIPFLILSLLVVILSFVFLSLPKVFASSDDILNDYSKESSALTNNVTVIDFFEKVLNEKLSNSEIKYLSDKGMIISYEDKVSTNFVSTSINDNELTVDASEYSYVDKSGRVVTWYPTEVELNNQKKSLVKTQEGYVCKFNNLEATTETINVYYKANFIVKKESINNLINVAYNAADYYVSNKIIENKNQEYLINKKAYDKYLEDLKIYEQNVIDYNKYLDLKDEWEAKNQKYNTYLSDYDQYLIEKVAYENYLNEYAQYTKDKEAYEQYLKEFDEYNQKKDENETLYQNYLANKAKADYQVAAAKLIEEDMTPLKRSIYDAVVGSTVSTVLSRKDDLIAIEPTLEAPIEYAKEATEQLRIIFSDLKKIKTDEEYFSFYVQSYNKLKKYLEQLLKSLDKMFRTDIVNKAFTTLDPNNEHRYKEKYEILLAQLGLLCNIVDDKTVYNYEAQLPGKSKVDLTKPGSAVIDWNWKINGKTIEQILGIDATKYNADEENGYPRVKTYPTPVERLVPPTEVKEPTIPTLVKEPIEPTLVENPGNAPTEVEKPILPTEVKEPTPYEVPELLQEMINDYNNNLLVKHNELTEDYNYEAISVMEKRIRDVSKVTIEFYDLEGNLLSKETTDKGSYMIFDGITPTKLPDDMHSEYKLVGWEYDDHEMLDLSNVTKDGYVYPVFEGVLRKFTIEWIVNGNKTTEEYEYGELPNYKGALTKKISDSKYYTFFGWNKEFTEVKSDNTYEAIFEGHPLIPLDNQNDGAIVSIDDSQLVISGIENQNEVNIKTLTEHMQILDYALLIKANNYEFKISKIDVKEIIKNEIQVIKINITNEDKIEYKLDFINDDIIELDFDVDVTINGEFDTDHSQLFVNRNGKLEKVRSTILNDKISFTMNSLSTYNVYLVYNVIVYESQYLDIISDKKEVIVGDTVNITLGTLKPGMTLDNLYVKDSLDNNITLNESSFIMPHSDVYIGVECSFIKYVINFIVDGEIISSNTYKYGDEIAVPNNPFKVSDEEYSYTFTGWDKDITEVYEDKDYNALFEKTAIEKEVIDNKTSIVKIIKIVLISVVATIVVATGLFLIIKKQSKKSVNKKI